MGLTALLGAARGPSEIVLVRHGESIGNLADAEARRAGADVLDLHERDADVPLSDNGRNQAAALREALASLDEGRRPSLVVSSPYRRAADTARTVFHGSDIDVVLDERLRERDLGLLDGLTKTGIETRFPDEVARRKKLGKFYYKPPSGESWADVVVRVRSLLADLREGYDGSRVWLFSHQAVIMSFRYVLEGLDEERLLEIERRTDIPNASLTHYRRTDDRLELVTFADTAHVDASGAERTHEAAGAGRHGGSDA